MFLYCWKCVEPVTVEDNTDSYTWICEVCETYNEYEEN